MSSFATEYQGWDAWAEKFKPKKNHLSKYDDLMYETYGEEWEYIKSVDPKYVWTYLDGDMSSFLIAGVSYVNRLGYYVTEVPWEDDMDSCLLSVEVDCECYDEEKFDWGDPDCEKCEGNGYVTEYVG